MASSSITLLDDNSESDLFTTYTSLRQPRRRRSSHFNRWIQDQQQHISVDDFTEPIDITDSIAGPANSSQCHPYLAYPQFSRSSLKPPIAADDDASQCGYDLVEDVDIPGKAEIEERAPSPNRTPRSSDIPSGASTCRKFHLPFQTPRGAGASSSKQSVFLRHTSLSPVTSSQTHSRSTSLSAISLPKFGSLNANSGWKWRPSVLGHFSSSAPEEISPPGKTDCQGTLPRPSSSSASAYTPTITITTEDESLLTPPKMSTLASTSSFGVVGPSQPFFQSSVRSSSSHSLYPPSSHHLEAVSEVGSVHALGHKPSAIRISSTASAPQTYERPQSYTHSNASSSDCSEPGMSDLGSTTQSGNPKKPYVAYSLSKSRAALPRVLLSSLSPSAVKNKVKKRILIVSGVSANDARKFEGIRKWCESFGEVNLITRMPNGDLQVHFRCSEVADTVCRLRAKVFISGVGSVHLSWCTSKKRSLLS